MIDEIDLIKDPIKLSKEFCNLVGIAPAKSFIYNKDTKELKIYASKSSQYRPPKGWTNINRGSYDKPIYPNFTESENFCKLLEIQWRIFGSLGPQYNKIDNETFPTNYVYSKIQAIKLCRSMGGGDMLEEYINQVRDTFFVYPIPEMEGEDYIVIN